MAGAMGWVLDKSIVFSFDRSGYRRHEQQFLPSDLDRSLSGKNCLVTGANSGLGFEIASGLAIRGAHVHMLCRNAERGAAARHRLRVATGNEDVSLHVIDLSDFDSVREFVGSLNVPQVDVLVHNAGLLPLERQLTTDGLELTVSTHLIGPFLLTTLLRSKLVGGRIVFVSSGGMYAKRLDVKTMLLSDGPYDGVDAYAMTKRGQVVLSEMLAQELAPDGITVNCMHPGWAATPGVERSLPRFFRFMHKRLRTPAEGADTALWLAIAERIGSETGKFWFDREAVPTHLVRSTRENREEREKLWQLCTKYSTRTSNERTD